MTPDRWRRVEELYHAALQRAEDERPRFLATACAEDEGLRREVDSLLAQSVSGATPLVTGGAVAAVERLTSASMVGRRLGIYEIQALVGVGGMGEVYRARDTKLRRDVAIKILPRAFTDDPDRLARFEREARVLAALNHPNIATIHGIEESDGIRALVMELVEGETLAARIAGSPLRVADALAIARQIAEALDASHEKGIVHRDLKPANIHITPSGAVKVLDFGLAKVAPGDGVSLQASWLTTGATREGVILGTAAYMSPEQTRGLPVDKRTDIWAFGCVLYEMLTGRPTFVGATVSDTVAAILDREPDWKLLPAGVPNGITQLLGRALTKDQRRRLRDIGDAKFEIEAAVTEQNQSPASATVGSERPARAGRALESRAKRLGWMMTLTAGAIVAAIAVTLVRERAERSEQPQPIAVRSLISVAPADQLRALSADQGPGEGRPSRTAMALSPDGQYLVFSAVRGSQQHLYLRPLTELEATPISGTEGGRGPFFSPDGRWLGFWASQDSPGGGDLLKVPFPQGGPTTRIGDLPPDFSGSFGASWGSDGTIVFAARTGGL